LPAAHGRSLVPVTSKRTGDEPSPDAIYYHYYESQSVHMVPAMYGARCERYKLIRYYEPQWDTWEMFDVEKEPRELRKAAEEAEYQVIRKQLEQRLAELRTLYGDDTGSVGGGEFPLTAGIARVERDGDDYRVWANTGGGYLLYEGERKG